jgi:lipoprotein signal peptidase
MPIISDIAIDSVVYDRTALTITINGVAFSENQYDGSVALSRNGGAYSAPAGTYTTWGDSQIVYTLNALLISGTYKVRVINGDNEEIIKDLAILIGGGMGNRIFTLEDGEADGD